MLQLFLLVFTLVMVEPLCSCTVIYYRCDVCVMSRVLELVRSVPFNVI